VSPEALFNLLSDPTRLRALMLILSEGELCVCELTFALKESQPKVSRHLALMRKAGVVEARRSGTWMYYRLHPDLPSWAGELVEGVGASVGELQDFQADLEQLRDMPGRPGAAACA